MRIDIVDKSMFRIYHEEIKIILSDLRTEIGKMRKLINEMNDRIKMLEDKNGI